MSQDEKNVAIRCSKKDEDLTIFIYCRVCFSSWCRNIDPDEILNKAIRWLLHENVKNDIKYALDKLLSKQ